MTKRERIAKDLRRQVEAGREARGMPGTRLGVFLPVADLDEVIDALSSVRADAVPAKKKKAMLRWALRVPRGKR